jgi:hypothetical protein
VAKREFFCDKYLAAAERADRRETEELPVHELAMALAAEHWFDSIAPYGVLGGDERG